MGKRAWGGVLVLAVVSVASAPAAAATGGVVAGTVTGGGQPLAAVCATLIGGGEETFHFDATETAVDGAYRFTDVPDGSYSLSFEDCDASPVFAPSDFVVEVAEGDDVDVDVALERGAFVTGRVADAAGTGLPSICVQAVDPTSADSAFFVPSVGRTTRDGTFRVGPLPAGPTVLRFEDCGVRPTHIAEWWQDTTDPASATIVELEAGLTASGFDVALARGARVTGGVTDADGAPVPGACVIATDELGDLVAGASVGPEDEVVAQLHEDQILRLLDTLDPQERRAVQLRTGLVDGRARSFREIGEELGLSDEGARRMVKRVLQQLRRDAAEVGLAA